jgi:hypothetical protein
MKKLNLKSVGALAAVSMLTLGVVGMQASSAFAQAQTPPATAQSVVTGTESIEAPAAGELVEAPTAGEPVEKKGADLDAIQAGPGQQLEQQGESTLDGNF